MFNPRKDFEKYINRTLGPLFKENGFKRYKVRSFVRITADNIVQSFNFQKSAGFSFYININSMPLSANMPSNFVEKGLRLSTNFALFNHTDSVGRFDFQTEYILNKGIEEIDLSLRQKVLKWFDIHGVNNSFIDYELNSDEVLILNGYHKVVELPFIYLLLQAKEYDAAEKYLNSMKERLRTENSIHGVKVNDEVLSLLTLIEKSDHLSIENLLLARIKNNLINFKLDKFKHIKVKEIPLAKYKELEYVPKEILNLPRNGGVESYHQILNGNEVMFNRLVSLFENRSDFKCHSESRIEITKNEKASFHFVLNTSEYVKEDTSEYYHWFLRRGVNLDEIKDNDQRIEIWCDYTIQSENSTYALRKELLDIVYKEISKFLFIPGQSKFYNS